MGDNYCPALATGAIAGAAMSPAIMSYIKLYRQFEWSRQAAVISCGLDPQSMSTAVGAIAAWQCHNKAAADWVVGPPEQVLRVLRA